MSHYCDETYDVYNETTRTARKPHQCSACKETIRVGDRYVYVFLAFDGAGETIRRCARCQTIHAHLRGLAPGEMWPDERLNCGEEYYQHWGYEPPPEIAALAFANADEMQRRLAPAADSNNPSGDK